MNRRIVQHGPSTLTISLPAAWVRQFALRKGDEISIEPSNNGLYISAGKEAHHGSKNIDVKGRRRIIGKAIAALYKRGYDEIIVEYESPQELERIHNTVSRSYIGFEIVDETNTTVIIRKVSEPSPEEFRTIFRRLFHFLITTAKEGYDAAAAGDKVSCERLVMRDIHINKLTNFCRRIINKHRQQEYAQETAIYHVLEQLEKIGDNYRDLNKHLVTSKKMSKGLLLLYLQVNQLLKSYEELFFDFSLQRMDLFLGMCEQVNAGTHKGADDPLAEYLLTNTARELGNLSGVTMILHL